jgi:hypothetical protein
MPNWCRNEIYFNLSNSSASNVMMEAILDFLKETIPNYDRRVRLANQVNDKEGVKFWEREILDRMDVDFNNLALYPDKFRIRDELSVILSKEEFKEKYGSDLDGYNSGGYEWCIQHWGSKWNAKDVVWVPQQKTLYFDTAWSPVFKIVSALHKRFPSVNISFEYYERGVGTVGGCEFICEEDWDPADYTADKVHSMEMAAKHGETPDPDPWEAGKPYNPWCMDYMGFKGG